MAQCLYEKRAGTLFTALYRCHQVQPLQVINYVQMGGGGLKARSGGVVGEGVKFLMLSYPFFEIK